MSALRGAYLGALVVAVLAACGRERDDALERPTFAASRATPGHAPSLDSTTHVRISLPESRTPLNFPRAPWVINEPRTVAALAEFVWRRDSLWRAAPSRRAPSSDPVMVAHFYRGTELVANVTLQMDQLAIEGQQGALVQPLSFSDAAAFLVLVGAPIKVIPVPSRDTGGRTL
jgi:hypothetical protein